MPCKCRSEGSNPGKQMNATRVVGFVGGADARGVSKAPTWSDASQGPRRPEPRPIASVVLARTTLQPAPRAAAARLPVPPLLSEDGAPPRLLLHANEGCEAT
jgi:hypothetical protein